MALQFLNKLVLGIVPKPTKERNKPVEVTYRSNHVDIPGDFLRGPSPEPITLTPVPFAASPVPEYAGCFAVTLDNVVSADECRQLIRFAEQSAVPTAAGDTENHNPWRPAMIAMAPGVEVPAPGYRESDRIVWDQQDVIDRIWERCCQAEGLRDMLAVVDEGPTARPPGRWELSHGRANMRFLRYSKGNFFKPHRDGKYAYVEDGKEYQSHYTLHLYLNDSIQVSPDSTLEGGATAFLSADHERRIDVNPKAGSVLIFQQRRLLHEGAMVTKGQKFTLRTDIMYAYVTDVEIPEDKDKI